MTFTAAQPATSAMTALVAGLDLLTSRERDADHLALRIAAVPADRGLGDIRVATQGAQVGHLRHVALTVGAVGDPAVLWEVLAHNAAAAESLGTGVLLADRYRGEPELGVTLTAAVIAHTNRTSGRAVVFPGIVRDHGHGQRGRSVGPVGDRPGPGPGRGLGRSRRTAGHPGFCAA